MGPDPGNWRDEGGTVIAGQYESAGIRRRLGFGERPAVVVVDLANAFTGGDHPLSSDMDDVVESTLELLEAARAKDVPIYFTTISYLDESGPGTWALKSPVLQTLVGAGHDTEIDPRLKRGSNEALVTKPGASSFFATNLAAMLTNRGVDTVIVTGGSTSGCVRATVVDAIQLGFRPIVPEECVGDRAEGPHKASLVDMDGKYGDVLPLEEVLGTPLAVMTEKYEPMYPPDADRLPLQQLVADCAYVGKAASSCFATSPKGGGDRLIVPIMAGTQISGYLIAWNPEGLPIYPALKEAAAIIAGQASIAWRRACLSPLSIQGLFSGALRGMHRPAIFAEQSLFREDFRGPYRLILPGPWLS